MDLRAVVFTFRFRHPANHDHGDAGAYPAELTHESRAAGAGQDMIGHDDIRRPATVERRKVNACSDVLAQETENLASRKTASRMRN